MVSDKCQPAFDNLRQIARRWAMAQEAYKKLEDSPQAKFFLRKLIRNIGELDIELEQAVDDVVECEKRNKTVKEIVIDGKKCEVESVGHIHLMKGRTHLERDLSRLPKD